MTDNVTTAIQAVTDAIATLRDLIHEDTDHDTGVITDWVIVAAETTFNPEGDHGSNVMVLADTQTAAWKRVGLLQTGLNYQTATVYDGEIEDEE